MKRNPKSTSGGLGRSQAMNAAPVAFPPLKTERKEGKLYVTVELERPLWQRVLGGDPACERTFGLDAFGQEVYGACDGNTSVNEIVKRFSKHHQLNQAEAELNVTTFLKTLISKGLIGIPLEESVTGSPEAAS
jgi:hypothetical protein